MEKKLKKTDESSKEKQLFEQYKLMIQARNFHYENFNKWMTFFYVATGALFLGYCTIVSADKIDHVQQNNLEFIIPIVGYITSLLWYWSSKGYYYWNINFITLINHYEKNLMELDVNERVYFVFANKNSKNNYLSPISGANISTSKVTILFSYLIASLWGVIIIEKYLTGNSLFIMDNNIKYPISILTSIGATFSLSFIPKVFLKSDMDNMPNLKIDLK